MGGGRATKVENVVERATAIVFAAALASSAFALLMNRLEPLRLGIVALGAFAGGYVVASSFLRVLGGGAVGFALPAFELPALDLEPWDELLLTELVELVLTEADRLTSQKSAEDELILDDILAKLGSDSRVVRLFEPGAMPTPGQLNARIESHLRQASAPPAPADASEALFEALTQLRRSLR
jgi:hypothetical protein